MGKRQLPGLEQVVHRLQVGVTTIRIPPIWPFALTTLKSDPSANFRMSLLFPATAS